METERDIEEALLKRLHLAALIEASTLILLVCVAVPFKHVWGWPVGVRFLGPVHGLAFIGYAIVLLQSVGAGMWQRRDIALLLLSAFVPFAGFRTARFFARHAQSITAHRGAQ